jgi:FkbM family methyltransferase
MPVIISKGQVLAVEPDAQICEIFREQLKLNHIDNCTVIQAAVADHEGVVTFVKSARDTRISALQGMSPIDGKSMDVPAMTLDGLAQIYPPPNMLKIDIEGAEIVALPGGETLFSGDDRPKHILLGVHGNAAKEFCEQFLKKHSYTLIREPGFDDDVTLVAVSS